jgi:hypothetical protein
MRHMLRNGKFTSSVSYETGVQRTYAWETSHPSPSAMYSFCWQCREQLVSTLYLCALYYASKHFADLRQSYKLMLLNYAYFPPMMLA